MKSEYINYQFARQDNCLDLMVPSDLRVLIGDRDRLKTALIVLLQEVHQMKDMFNDEDNNIENAIKDAEIALYGDDHDSK